MRNDLTANFLAAMASDSREPIQILQFRFINEWQHLSDREGQISGFPCQGLVENWGNLSTSGEENSVSGTMEMSVSIWNGGDEPFSNNFFDEDPMNVEVWVYQTFEGLASEDVALIGTFVVQDPIRFTEGARLLSLDLVTTNMRYFAQVGTTLTRDEYPYALESDLNKSIDLIVGDCGNVQTLCSRTPATCTQSGSILLLPTTINTIENLDELGFYTAGYLQIDAEILVYYSRTSHSFNVTIRGYNLPGLPTTIASDHSDGSTILQANVPIDYIVGQGPLGSISNVLVNGQTPTIPYTVYPDGNPAIIRFDAQPVYTEFSRGARSIDVDFDAVSNHNTANFPERAYNTDFRSYGAIISRNDNRTLSIYQADTALDDGEVVRVFLNVEHWATGQYNNDNCYVYAEGVYLGALSKPDPKDTIELDADVDVDHGHTHSVGGIHDHGYTDSTLATNNVPHDHTATGFGQTYTDSGEVGFPYSIGAYSNSESRFYYSGHSDIESQTLHFRARQQTTGEIDLVFGDKTVTWQPGSENIDQYVTTTAYSTRVTIRVDGEGVIGSYLEILEMTLESTTGSDINPRTTAIDTTHSSSGVVALQNVGTDTSRVARAGTTTLKAEDDVDRITEEERIKQLNVISADTSSKRITNKFDVTQYLPSVSWDWLHGKAIDIVYTGSDNNVEVVITYVYFEVEYRQKQIRTTNNVTAYAVGHSSVGWRPDEVIQYLLTQKAGVPLESLGSVWRNTPTWDDNETWWDFGNVWLDYGQVAGAPYGAAFQEAAAWYSYRDDYKVDGVIPGTLSVKDALSRLTFQTRSRLLWQNGKVKLVVLRKSDGWNIAKDLGTDIIQMRSLSVEKTTLAEIVNKIELCHDIDYLSEVQGAGQYRATAIDSDSVSITKNGERQQEDLFLFDYIRNSDMAQDIAEYYIWLYGESRSLYGLITYLPNFDLEKSDYISINSTGFQQIQKLPVTIRELVRNYGSGKNGIINTLDIIGESIRHKIYSIKEYDEVFAFDNLSIYFGFELEFDDIANVTDFLLIVTGKEFDDSVSVADAFNSIFSMAPKLTDTVPVLDELAADIEVYLDDEVIIDEDFSIAQELCWGACGWGAPNCVGPVWGSNTVHRGGTNEYMSVLDSLIIQLDAGGIEDEAIITDELCFSDGWGCPTGNGSGFGLSPFGDMFCTTT